MTVDRSFIRVKAMLLAPNPERTAHAVREVLPLYPAVPGRWSNRLSAL
ncbi:hypothetical protein JOE61_000103 [Nocardioides salarius]|uniref:Uncharacterized protein n=1 Tax=Nocardioides salarius TaxID=374513 RepID=A0ABS2M530_9ACTN|nr:hypothetical protein [Nocardioides salarius]MBM7506289.1 hypothetical protein [Nocardioides salarius]